VSRHRPKPAAGRGEDSDCDREQPQPARRGDLVVILDVAFERAIEDGELFVEGLEGAAARTRVRTTVVAAHGNLSLLGL
jgi:hypothetical protein